MVTAVWVAADIDARESAGGGRWKDFKYAIPAFRGCDYNVKPDSLPFSETMEGYVNTTDKKKFLADIETNFKWPPKAHGIDDGGKPAKGFAEEAECTMNMFLGHPVFRLSPKEGSNNIDVSKLPSKDAYGAIELVPLYDRPQFSEDNGEGWGRCLGYEKSPAAILGSLLQSNGVSDTDYHQLLSMEIWARGGKPIEQERIPYPLYDNRYMISHLAELNVDPHNGGIPLGFLDVNRIRAFLQERRTLPPSHAGTIPRPRLEEAARATLDKMKRSNGLQPVPRSLSESRKDSGTFSIEQVILPPAGEQWQWDQKKVMHTARKVMKINDESINNKIYQKKRNGVRYRACRRVDGGNCNVSTFSVTEGRHKETGRSVLLFRILMTPSQKSDPYWVYSAFEKETGDYIPYPGSRCECPIVDGCSHSLAFIGGPIYLAQAHTEWTTDTLAEAMPESIKPYQSYPIPFEAGAFESSKVEKEVKAEGRATLAFFETHGSRERYHEDENIEMAAQNEADDGTPTIQICANTEAMVAKARKRAELTETERDFAHRVTLDKIRNMNKEKLEGKGGPNESLDSKRQQLEMLERLHQEVKAGNLPRTLLSHYAEITKPCRDRLLKQLTHVTDPSIIRQKDRLLKIEEDDQVCGDKNFNNTSCLYPNGNEMICPKHLVGKHYDIAEVGEDEGIKSLRWSSEGVFTRVIDDAYVRDVIPSGHFPYLHHAINYSQGRANLYAPYHAPDPNLHPANKSHFEEFEEKKLAARKRKETARDNRAKKKVADLQKIAEGKESS